MSGVVAAARPSLGVLVVVLLAALITAHSLVVVAPQETLAPAHADPLSALAVDMSGPAPGPVGHLRGDPLPQDDADSGGNADDACFPGYPPSVQVPTDSSFRGTLRPPLDRADYYALPVAFGGSAALLNFSVEQNPDYPLAGLGYQHRVQVLDSFCDVIVEVLPGLFEDLVGVALFDDPGDYVIAVLWEDHGLWPFAENGGPTLHAVPVSATDALPARADERECHAYCTSYRVTTTLTLL